MNDPEPVGHGLHRLAAPVEHQLPRIHPCRRPLILAFERGEHFLDERIETFTGIGQGCGIHLVIVLRIASKLEALHGK